MREPMLLNYFMMRMLTSTDAGAEARPSPNHHHAQRWKKEEKAHIDYEPLMVLLVAAACVVCAVVYKGGV